MFNCSIEQLNLIKQLCQYMYVYHDIPVTRINQDQLYSVIQLSSDRTELFYSIDECRDNLKCVPSSYRQWTPFSFVLMVEVGWPLGGGLKFLDKNFMTFGHSLTPPPRLQTITQITHGTSDPGGILMQ